MWIDAKDELYVNNSTVAGIISLKLLLKHKKRIYNLVSRLRQFANNKKH